MRCPAAVGTLALRSSLSGYGETAQRGNGARLERGWSARLYLYNPGAGMTICLEVFLDPDFSSIE